jgi:hypothetical protein
VAAATVLRSWSSWLAVAKVNIANLTLEKAQDELAAAGVVL